MNFLYLIKRPLVQRDYDRHGIGFMLAHGHKIAVLDLSKVIHPDLTCPEAIKATHPNLTLHQVNTWREMEYLKPLFSRSTLVFLFIQSSGLTRSNYPVLRMLSRTGTPYLIQAPALFPGWDIASADVSPGRFIKDLWERFRDADPINSVIARLSPSVLGLPLAKYVVYSSQKSKHRLNLVGPATRAIDAHTYDFDDFIQSPERETEEKAQAVFIDQFMPFHEDYKSINARPIDPDGYYSALRDLFDRIERELGLNVVIAAHPRANYTGHPDWFGGRPIYVGETKRLIAESRLSLVHTSTVVGYAILLRKPVMILTTRSLYDRQAYEKHYYEGFAKEIGTSLRFIDVAEDTNLDNALDVDEERYEKYLSDYMRCPGSPDRPYWEIVLDAVAA